MSQNQPVGSNNRLAKAGGRRPDALPAGLVGFSAGRRLQKLSSAPRALARLQLLTDLGTTEILTKTVLKRLKSVKMIGKTKSVNTSF